jgi:hypothetical protein
MTDIHLLPMQMGRTLIFSLSFIALHHCDFQRPVDFSAFLALSPAMRHTGKIAMMLANALCRRSP